MLLNKLKLSFLLRHFRYCGTSAAGNIIIIFFFNNNFYLMYVINVENDFFKPLGTKLNYYEILGIKPDSDSKTIKEAFYEQSKKLHPDKRYYTCIYHTFFKYIF